MSRRGISSSHLRFLRDLFGEGDVLTSAGEMAVYGSDASREFAMPWVVVRPSSSSQVRELLKWAHMERVPLVPRARASNVVGACVPVRGGVVVSTLRLNRILDIDDTDFVAEVEPGIITAELQALLEERGLFYPPDPASASISTIGGNVAQNAGGLRAVKYGVTRDYVLGLDVILPGGKPLCVGGRNLKDVVGLSLLDLFVGSEGTLGFFSRIILRLLPMPEDSLSILLGYTSLSRAVDVGIQMLRRGLVPVAMEFMDADVIDCVRDISPISFSPSLGGLLLVMFQGNKGDVSHCLKVVKEGIARGAHLFQWGREAQEKEIWEVRRLINPASHRLGEHKIALDIAVPRSRVVEVVEKSKGIGGEYHLPVLTFGHLGDGNIHVNIMYGDGEEEFRAAKDAASKILGVTLDVGGTISGEHGVGIIKLPYISRQLSPEELRIMRGIKRLFDPHNIMNPGKAY